MHAAEQFHSLLDYADRIHRLFAAMFNVKYLKVSGPYIGDPDIVYLYRLPTSHNLNHLEIHLQSCCYFQLLTNFLNVSSNLESPIFENNIQCRGVIHDKCDLVHEWCPPESVHICLLSCLERICIRGFEGGPDKMEVAEYLLKHGVLLSKVQRLATLNGYWGRPTSKQKEWILAIAEAW